MNLDDNAYIRFAESRGLYIPDNDCADYREQEDYLAVQFMNQEAESLRQQITELQKKCRAAEKLISDSVECVDFMLEMYPAKTNGVSSTMGAMQFDVWQQYYFLRKRARIFQKDYPKTE